MASSTTTNPTTRTVVGKCSRCGYSGDHDIVAMHAKGVGFCFGLECPACGYLVPESAWQKYQKTGDVIIPNMHRATKKDVRTTTKGTRNYV